MSDRLNLFKEALSRCQCLEQDYPGIPAITSIQNQLEYLIGLESGASDDRSRLGEIVIGVMAAREIEPLDMEVANLLHKVAGEARQL